MSGCKGVCLVCTGRLTYVKRHSGPYSLVQKIGKLSSVAPGEQCTDTLRSCRNHMHVQKPWKVHVNIIVLPVMATCIGMVVYPHCWAPKWGYWEYTLKPNCKGDTVPNRSWDGKSTMVSLRMQQPLINRRRQSKLSPLDC